MDQLTGGVRATAPSEGLLLPWLEPTTTAPAGVVSLMKALSWCCSPPPCSYSGGKPPIRVPDQTMLAACRHVPLGGIVLGVWTQLEGPVERWRCCCWCSLCSHDARAPVEGPEALLRCRLTAGLVPVKIPGCRLGCVMPFDYAVGCCVKPRRHMALRPGVDSAMCCPSAAPTPSWLISAD